MVMTSASSSVLRKLGIDTTNRGACYGADGWIDASAGRLSSLNPATGQEIAGVSLATPESYDRVVGDAAAAFETWRERPAPKRGDLVRDLGNALRDLKEPLGDLVALEMGKIRVEGHGGVQEMIDICDFAVGLSRQLYGSTLASERPGHRMMEQWQPLGPVGIITAFNFPVAVWAWNAALSLVCGDPVIWKPSHLTPLTAIAVQRIVNRVLEPAGLAGLLNLTVGSRDIGVLMSSDGRLPLISATGSCAMGKSVAGAVAGRMG